MFMFQVAKALIKPHDTTNQTKPYATTNQTKPQYATVDSAAYGTNLSAAYGTNLSAAYGTNLSAAHHGKSLKSSEKLGIGFGVTLPICVLVALCAFYVMMKRRRLVNAATLERRRADDTVSDPLPQAYNQWNFPQFMTEFRARNLVIHKRSVAFSRVLGRGHFGTVFHGILNIDGRQTAAAVKIQSTHNGPALKESAMEAWVMIQFEHPNVVRLLRVVSTTLNTDLWIAMEFMSGGTLAAALRSGVFVHFDQLTKVIEQVASGLAYLASRRFVHRDLRAANVLLDTLNNGVDETTAKIADFGLTRSIQEDREYYTVDGDADIPIRWMAPEVLDVRKGIFSLASDVWAFGVLMWECFTGGRSPWSNFCLNELRDRLGNGERLGLPEMEQAPEQQVLWHYLMRICWAARPHDRPTARAVHQQVMILRTPEEQQAGYANLEGLNGDGANHAGGGANLAGLNRDGYVQR